jgi:hypothetical protein
LTTEDTPRTLASGGGSITINSPVYVEVEPS